MKKYIINILIVIFGIFVFWYELLFGIHYALKDEQLYAVLDFGLLTIWVAIIFVTCLLIKYQVDDEKREQMINFIKNLPDDHPLSLKSAGIKK